MTLHLVSDRSEVLREQIMREQGAATGKWRVMLYMSGDAQFYNDYTIEALADRWAADMRALYAKHGVQVFLKKEKIS